MRMKKLQQGMPKTIRHSMPVKEFEAMGKQNPRMPGMKCCTRRRNPNLNTMNFYYK